MKRNGFDEGEIIITGYFNPENKTFTIIKNGSYVPNDSRLSDKKKTKFSLLRTFFQDRVDDIVYGVNIAFKRAQLKVIRAKEGIGIPLFCDSEGKVYFFDDQSVQHFISEDNRFSLNEYGEFFSITQTDEGFVLDKLPGFEEAFPFKLVNKPKEDEFDFDEEMSGFEPLVEKDPFAEPEPPKKSKIIDFEAAKFLRERDGRRR